MSSNKNTFSNSEFMLEEENVDDFTFLSHPQQGTSGYMIPENTDSLLDRRQQLLEERRVIQERTLQSSHVSMGLLNESERIGISTAEELICQGEQLKNVEQKVDEINSTMRVSQKHINSMKSVLGSIKNYFSRNSNSDVPTKPPFDPLRDESKGSKLLQEKLEKLKEESSTSSSSTHPALRIRGIDTSGFTDQFDDAPKQSSEDDSSPYASYKALAEESENKLNSNLEEMSLGLGRLKNLAVGLQDEIDDQNEVLDRISGKVYKADESLEHQNRQIRRILNK